MYVFATGAGWRGWMTRRESMRVNLLWNAILPTLTFFKGYTPMSMLGMGEDLPYGVYKQWRQWCKYPHYFFDDPIVSEKMQEKFAQVLQRVERLRTQLCRFYTYDPNLNGFRNITSRFS